MSRLSFKSSHGRLSFQYPSSHPRRIHAGLKRQHLHSDTLQTERGCVCVRLLSGRVCVRLNSLAQNRHLPLTLATRAEAMEGANEEREENEQDKRAERK